MQIHEYRMVINLAVTKVALMVGLILSVLLIIPASAFAATGADISGKVDFPTVAYSFYSTNETTPSENLTVSELTIYAMNVQTGFVNVTTPNADGTYSIHVSDPGLYQIYLKPDSVADLTRGASLIQYFEYPNREGTRLYIVDVAGETVKADIQGYAPGYYQPPNSLTLTSDTSASANVTTGKPSATAAPAPGFMALIVLAGMIVAAVALLQRKN